MAAMRLPAGAGQGGVIGRPLARPVAGKFAGISHPHAGVTPEMAPPPWVGVPHGSGVWPRPTGADPTGARDFTPYRAGSVPC
jgi:hypothetical protein